VAASIFPQFATAQKKHPDQQTAKSHPAQIDKNGVLILIRSTLLALDQANKTGNYTVLRDLGAQSFQATNTAARLADIFAAHRKANFDLSGIAVLEPQLTLLPEIDAQGMMRMAGFFPSVPAQIKFDLVYAPVSGQWRLFGIGVSLGRAAPVAPDRAVQSSTVNNRKLQKQLEEKAKDARKRLNVEQAPTAPTTGR
jgi:hypothetical protein